MNAVLAQRDIAEKLIKTGSGEPHITTPAEFAAMIKADYEKYGKVIKDTGVKVDN